MDSMNLIWVDERCFVCWSTTNKRVFILQLNSCVFRFRCFLFVSLEKKTKEFLRLNNQLVTRFVFSTVKKIQSFPYISLLRKKAQNKIFFERIYFLLPFSQCIYVEMIFPVVLDSSKWTATFPSQLDISKRWLYNQKLKRVFSVSNITVTHRGERFSYSERHIFFLLLHFN